MSRIVLTRGRLTATYDLNASQRDLVRAYGGLAMSPEDRVTPSQQQALCDLIGCVSTIINGADGTAMTPGAATSAVLAGERART